METCTRPLTVITDSEDTNRPRPWGTPTHCIVYSRISATRGQMAWFFSALILLVTLILFVSTCKTQTFFATIKTKSIRPNMAPRKPNERQWRSDTKQLQKKNKQKNSNLSLCLVLPLQQWTVTECKPHTLNMQEMNHRDVSKWSITTGARASLTVRVEERVPKSRNYRLL